MTGGPRWSGAQLAPTVRRGPCRHHCGTPVDSFRDVTGLVVQLATSPPPITQDLTGMRGQVFTDLGPRIGWVSTWNPARRTWREMRIVHTCAPTHTQKETRP